jgi:sulfatase modifying factor 1
MKVTAWAIAGALLASGCQVIGGFQDFERGTPQVSETGCPMADDPGLHGASMAQVARPDGSCFWIDTTEVTVGQYRDFLAADIPAQDGVCAWNNADASGLPGSTPGLAPSEDCVASGGAELAEALEGGGEQDLPITCVDWCDALAFCIWAGKDLCSDDGDHQASAQASDWFRACSGSDEATYGCGVDCTPNACNGAASKNGKLEAVGSIPGCHASGADPAARLYDLSGNAAEWSNWCSPDRDSGDCLVRGGSYASNDATLECGNVARTPRLTSLPTLGFRCCKG